MAIYEKLLERRSVRRFLQKTVDYELLERCVNAARLAPSARNTQPLEYMIIDDPRMTGRIFSTVRWGGLVPESKLLEQRAPAYILIMLNKRVRTEGFDQDVGLAAGNMILTALEKGVYSCCLRAVDWTRLRDLLSIPGTHDPVLLVAFGYPCEKSVAEDAKGEDLSYYRDDNGVLHVPKRKLGDVLHRNNF